MNVVFVQSSTLSIGRAHWIQILNTAWAAARAGMNVVVMPRTFAPGTDAQAMEGMGFSTLPNLTFVPLLPRRLVSAFSLSGDPLSTRQGLLVRKAAVRSLDGVLRELGPSLVYTRDQEVPLVAAKALENRGAIAVNELHKFEYVKRLEGKLGNKRPGRRTLSHFKKYARSERDEEISRLARFAGVVCTTPSIRERLVELGFEGRTAWIPNGANLEAGETPSAAKEKDIDILYVGQLLRWKNVDEVIEALPLLPERHLTVVGGQPGTDMDRLVALAERVGVRQRVEFAGQRPHGEIKGIMQRARVGVVPLPRAGFPEARLFCNPLKALEMMAAGTPFVATRLRSVEGLLEHGRNAYLVEPDDTAALAEGIRAVLASEELRQRLVAGGIATAHDLSYDSRAAKIAAFARECGLGA